MKEVTEKRYAGSFEKIPCDKISIFNHLLGLSLRMVARMSGSFFNYLTLEVRIVVLSMLILLWNYALSSTLISMMLSDYA